MNWAEFACHMEQHMGNNIDGLAAIRRFTKYTNCVVATVQSSSLFVNHFPETSVTGIIRILRGQRECIQI